MWHDFTINLTLFARLQVSTHFSHALLLLPARQMKRKEEEHLTWRLRWTHASGESLFFFGLHGCLRLFRMYILIGPDWSLFNPAALARIRHRSSTADVFRSVCHHYAKLGAQSQSRMTWRLNASTKSGPKWVKRLVLLSSWQVETVTCSNILLLLLLLPSPLCSCESFHLSESRWRIYDSSDASRKTDFYWGMVEGWVKSIKNKKCIFDDIRTDGSLEE